jgi:hypothetical protein
LFVDTATWQQQAVVDLNLKTPRYWLLSNMVFSADRRELAVLFEWGWRGAALINGRTGELRHTIAEGLTNLADDKEEEKRIFMGGEKKNSIRAIALSADGKWLASGGTDTVISVWEVERGKEVLRLPGHNGEITTLAFNPDGRTLSSFGNDGQGFRWNLMPKPAAGPRVSLAELWDAMDQMTPSETYQAQWLMIAEPNESATLLRDRLTPVQKADAAKIQHWIADLGSDTFTVRDTATKELLKVGEQVQVPVRQALTGELPLDTRRRLKQILDTVTAASSPETQQTFRGIMVLERIGSPEAKSVLAALARGAPGTRVTEESVAALKRLDKRVATAP